MPKFRVAIIVLNYHGAAVLPACIASLTKAIHADDQILIVDNGNEKALLALIKHEFPQIKTLSLEKNGGFAAGMNAGIRFIQDVGGAEAYWLLNNDTSISPETLDALFGTMEAVGEKNLFSPIIRSSVDGPIWFAGGKIDFLRMKTVHRQSLNGKQVFSTDFLTGCALFIPAASLAALGYLDERYFLYAEDAEFSLRARRKGFGLKVVPAATVYHSEESERNPGKTYWLVRSSAEFFLRESPKLWKLWIWPYYGLRRLKNRFRLILSKNTLASEIERAYTDVSL
ncbi:MAG: glycosyltransferase family 2 protein [Undibacterium sp.]